MRKTIIGKRKKTVTDPVRDAEERFDGTSVRDAEERYGGAFVRKKTVSPWETWISRCTTGQFSGLDGGYHRHCGPTAITNLILTLNRRYRYFDDPVPAEVFSAVSKIGQKKKIYWNTDILGHFGGTYDMFTELYIRACLKYYGIPVSSRNGADRYGSSDIRPVTIRWSGFPAEIQFIRALDAGKLLYLQLHHHPCYGSHHLLCYGYTIVQSIRETDEEKENGAGPVRKESGAGPVRRQREIYLILADGWNRQPRYLRLKSRGICHFFAIG